MAKTYNPYCIVNYFYYETTGKMLCCGECLLEKCECKKVRVL